MKINFYLKSKDAISRVSTKNQTCADFMEVVQADLVFVFADLSSLTISK
ncbi:hypothetical protein NIES4074_51710 [Cylindrospermum sp. NIES-4074]|nr:hypothetical protein NIES4074_51710 [Cylindrospermum sp. NIES-4074]